MEHLLLTALTTVRLMNLKPIGASVLLTLAKYYILTGSSVNYQLCIADINRFQLVPKLQ